MARYTGPMTKKSRRLGTDLVGNDKAFERRPYPPGVHGRGRTKDSEYSLQLKEKQKARYAYGVLEKQFRRYYEEADRHPGKTGDRLLQILESRLDNVVYRAGFAATRRQARQLVVHGHFIVNGQRVNIPSYRVKEGDVIAVRDRSRQLASVLEASQLAERDVPDYLEVDHSKMTATFVRMPGLADVPYAVQMEPHLVIEYYAQN